MSGVAGGREPPGSGRSGRPRGTVRRSLGLSAACDNRAVRSHPDGLCHDQTRWKRGWGSVTTHAGHRVCPVDIRRRSYEPHLGHLPPALLLGLQEDPQDGHTQRESTRSGTFSSPAECPDFGPGAWLRSRIECDQPDIRLREFLVRRGRTRSRRRSTSHSRPRTRVSSPPFGPSNRSPSSWTLIRRNLGTLARA